MTTKQIRDLCGLYCVAEFANYEYAEFLAQWGHRDESVQANQTLSSSGGSRDRIAPPNAVD